MGVAMDSIIHYRQDGSLSQENSCTRTLAPEQSLQKNGPSPRAHRLIRPGSGRQDMSKIGWRASGAACTVVVGAAIGLATNIVTDRPTWGWVAGTVTLVLCGAVLAALTVIFENRTSETRTVETRASEYRDAPPRGAARRPSPTAAGYRPPPPAAAQPVGAQGVAAHGVRNTVIRGDGNRVGMTAGFVLAALTLVGAIAVSVLFVALRFGPSAGTGELSTGAAAAGLSTESPATGATATGADATDAAPTPTVAEVLATLPPTGKDFTKVKARQCVRNNGPDNSPQIEITQCRYGVYYVLRRIDGYAAGEADAVKKCAPVPAYTKWFFYESADNTSGFVLCLREMPPNS
jgi:hypothetical protein